MNYTHKTTIDVDLEIEIEGTVKNGYCEDICIFLKKEVDGKMISIPITKLFSKTEIRVYSEFLYNDAMEITEAEKNAALDL